MAEARDSERFAELALPHLDDAYSLARWLMRDAHDAEDLVQEAFLRAWRSFDTFQGRDARPWLLSIVRNACFSSIGRRHLTQPLDDADELTAASAVDPLDGMVREIEAGELRRAVEELPVEFREIVVMRDMQGLSYREIAQVAGLPVGTVMSRLARGRRRLQRRLSSDGERGAGMARARELE